MCIRKGCRVRNQPILVVKMQLVLGVFGLMLCLASLGCAGASKPKSAPVSFQPTELELVAESPRYKWTGVAVVTDPAFYDRPNASWATASDIAPDRVFVNFPYWNERAPMQVVEIMPDGTFRAYPDDTWQEWAEGDDPSSRFVCVQSVHVDLRGRLWVLDTGAPGFQGPVAGAAKLVEIDPATDRVVRTIRFDDWVAPEGTYLNDVRVHAPSETAVITDSGRGGLILVDLRTGDATRLLDGDPLTTADPTRDGKPFAFEGEIAGFLAPDGSVPQIQSDGLAIVPESGMFAGQSTDPLVVWQTITGTTLRAARINQLRLAAEMSDPDAYLARVPILSLAGTPVSDGLAYDPYQGILYFSALEHNGVAGLSVHTDLATILHDEDMKLIRPTGPIHPSARVTEPARSVAMRITHPDLDWPDSFAISAAYIYVTSAQIHLESPFEYARVPAEPYRLFRFKRR